MNAAPDRRTVLGAVLTAGACLRALVGWRRHIGRRSCPRRHTAPPAGIRRIHGGLGPANVSDLYDRANAEEGAAAELRRFRELETEEEAAFSSLLATRPTTKASAIAWVNHVADCGLASDEMRAWLAMMVESPLVA
jgi:hypothetical protein